MKTSRRSALKQLSFALLAGFSPLAGFGSSEKNRLFTGEEMYRGIFFAEGQFARLIPEIQSLKAAYATSQPTGVQVETVRRQIIDHLKQTDAAFFTRFKAALLSQNVLTIQQQLRTASERTAQTLKTLYSSPTSEGSGYQLKKVADSSQGAVIVVVNVVACVDVIYILSAATIFEDEQIATTQKASPLLIEQIAFSICSVVRTAA
ncbi:hypothetical protein [Spirosoma radiotolerans]|uniref:Uncharacterized protein n=1 Tax=Spirosoma radiotolerans TaxID=1379870 RepID=A0A0E3ZWN1_9BACT|nr:hypothetical protein [Spirosoma radiotolerans]AKD55838.1 hypothetical protein SD10_13955 [Spirosoma radiotolerans]